MVEIRRGSEGFGGNSGLGSERLPWLEPVEDEDGADYGGETPAGYGGVLLAAIGVLIGIAVLTAAIVWWRHHRAATADIGQVIHAPAEPYKVRPADPGGMKPDKNGEVSYGTSAGQDIDSPLDLSALPEQPVASRHAAPAAPAPAASPAAAPTQIAPASAATPVPVAPPAAAPKSILPAPAPVKPAVVKPAAVPAAEASAPIPSGPSGTIQLGAFSTEAKANAVWKSLAGRFTWLKGLEKAVVPVASDGKTLYRLRASGPGAPGFCARLRIAGETCAGV